MEILCAGAHVSKGVNLNKKEAKAYVSVLFKGIKMYLENFLCGNIVILGNKNS